MAVLNIAEKKRKAALRSGTLTASRVFQIKTDRGDKETVVASVLPSIGSQHDVLFNCFCVGVDIDLQENGVEWICNVQYNDERELGEDPTSDPVFVDWDGEIYTEAIFEDTNGEAITNSAGDYFVDPSPTKEKSHLIARVEANVPSVPAWLMTYRDVTNDAAIVVDGLSVSAGLAFIQRPKVSRKKYRNDYEYRTVNIDIHIHPDGWKLRPMDVGFREKNASDATQRDQITNDGDNEEPTTPVPLDGSGNALVDPTPSTVVFLEFDIHEEKDFSALPGITAG